MNKIFLIDKKEWVSSYDMVRDLKHKFHISKIGHCGTLDPFASGLLIIMAGEATKISDYLMTDTKEYIATLKLGATTNTFDTEGEIVETKEIPILSEQLINKTFSKFIGKQLQTPPIYSAIKKDGMKLYDFARQGIEVDVKPRQIEIFSLDLISFDKTSITFKTLVSKGTYIRSLGVDIAKSLNTVGYLTSLRRTKVGNLDVKDAIDISKASEENGLDIKDCLEFRQVIVDESRVKNGEKIKLDYDDEYVLLINLDGKELAIYQKDNNIYKCKRGFNL